jgi:hypothetical protein
MPEITDEYMQAQLATSREYVLVLLKEGENYRMEDGRDAIVWEHGRRNFSLRADGRAAIVGPVVDDDTDLCGVMIFNAGAAEAAEIIAGDPAVEAGIFTYEVRTFRSFPGDALAAAGSGGDA